jgi:predicted DNA-binding transcriptional regulator AlpA
MPESKKPPAKIERLLTVKDVAAIFKISERTPMRWVEQGQGPPVVILPNGSLRWRPEVVRRFIEAEPEQASAEGRVRRRRRRAA